MDAVEKTNQEFMARINSEYEHDEAGTAESENKDANLDKEHEEDKPLSFNDEKRKHLTDEEEFVKDLIDNNKIVVFSKSWCPYSTKTKNLLKKLKLDFEVYEIDKEKDGDNVFKTIKEMTS